ncbi:hypothetical protein, partial [Kribbia dieselivorans]|uniref:hypothetical protein n=1 Tax=Kribbia dieselivorans TaxID=331526 RepID=UPI001C3F2866
MTAPSRTLSRRTLLAAPPVLLAAGLAAACTRGDASGPTGNSTTSATVSPSKARALPDPVVLQDSPTRAAKHIADLDWGRHTPVVIVAPKDERAWAPAIEAARAAGAAD